MPYMNTVYLEHIQSQNFTLINIALMVAAFDIFPFLYIYFLTIVLHQWIVKGNILDLNFAVHSNFGLSPIVVPGHLWWQ